MKDYLGNILNDGDKILYIKNTRHSSKFAGPTIVVGDTEKSFRCVNNLSDTVTFCVLKRKSILVERAI